MLLKPHNTATSAIFLLILAFFIFYQNALFVLNPVYPAADLKDSLPVGGDDTGSWVAVFLNMLQDLTLYFDIQGGGGFVQKQEGRPAQQRPGDGETLGLAF